MSNYIEEQVNEAEARIESYQRTLARARAIDDRDEACHMCLRLREATMNGLLFLGHILASPEYVDNQNIPSLRACFLIIEDLNYSAALFLLRDD